MSLGTRIAAAEQAATQRPNATARKLQMLLLLLIFILDIGGICAFGIVSSSRRLPSRMVTLKLFDDSSTSRINDDSRNNIKKDRLYEIPLLDVLSFDDYPATQTAFIQPLPSRHLPNKLRTGHVYGVQLTVPLHQSIIQHAVDNTRDQVYGHLASYAKKPSPTEITASTASTGASQQHSLVGAIGCTAQVLLNAPASDDTLIMVNSGNDQSDSSATTTGRSAMISTVLCLGLDRFIVREVIQSVPYVVALVENLDDDDDVATSTSSQPQERDAVQSAMTNDLTELNHDRDDDEDDDDVDDVDDESYANLTPTELLQRTLRAMEASVELLQAEAAASASSERSLLEESILQAAATKDDSVDAVAAAAQQAAVDETVAVWHVFQQALVDDIVTPHERYYAVANMAAEVCQIDNFVRRQMLVETNTLQRLRLVCAAAERSVSTTRARRLAQSITTASDEASKDLTVGTPTLPLSWAKSIRVGTVVEYYWNEEHGWCRGTVVREPEFVIDEVILTVHFVDDNSTHRLPLTAPEKARWRPV